MSAVARVRSSETLNGAGLFANGILSSFATMVFTQPLDRWKTDRFSGNARSSTGLYRGFGINCASIVPVWGLAFGFYHTALKRLAPSGQATDRQKLEATVLGTTVATPVAAVFEKIKVAQQLRDDVTVRDVVRRVVATEGLYGLVKGGGPIWWRGYLWYTGMLAMRQKIQDAQPKALTNRTVRKIVADAETGAMVGGSTALFDNLRAKVQGDGWGPIPKGTYPTVRKTVTWIIRNEGIRGLIVPKGTLERMGFAGAALVIMGGASDAFPEYLPSFLHRQE